MKPDWKDAPKWARFLAMDEDGKWYWYENEPTMRWDYWGWIGQVLEAKLDPSVNWKETLEPRP